MRLLTKQAIQVFILGLLLLSQTFLSLAQAQSITELSGVVEFRQQPNSLWRPADIGDSFTFGSAIRTFEGTASLTFTNDDLIKLDLNTQLTHNEQGFNLDQGRLYVSAWKLPLNISESSQVEILGESRFTKQENLERIVVLSGSSSGTFNGELFNLSTAEQLVLNEEGLKQSAFVESDPWYRDLSVLGFGQGVVIGKKGKAEVFLEGAWHKAELEDVVTVGSSIRTDASSWLELRFDDGNLVRLQSETELLLSSLEDLDDGTRQTSLELKRGKVWVIVETKDQPFQIETPGLIAGVRGTTFRVDAAGKDDPALIKTFEGSVAGIQGVDLAVVDEGAQFDPLAGVAPLQLDDLDKFNIKRDELLDQPIFSLNPTPLASSSPNLSLSGLTDAGALVQVAGRSVTAEESAFELEVPLRSGFNLLRLSVRTPDGSVLQAVRPVIYEGINVFVDGQLEDLGHAVLLRGVATPHAEITVTGSFGSQTLTANEDARFELRLPAGVTRVALKAELQGVTSETGVLR